MNIKNLRAFIAVVRAKGFTQAATSLYLSQSAVSKAIKSLEDELDVVLIHRKTPTFTLTPMGEVVYQRALILQREVETLSAEIDEFKGMTRGVLRIGVPPVASGVLFASLFATFRSLYPGIEIELIERGGQELTQLLTHGKIEIAATLGREDEALNFWALRCEPLWLILDKTNPLAYQKDIDLKELKTWPFILFEKGFSLNRIIVKACRARGFSPKISARSTQIDFIVDLVAAKLGIALLPRVLALQYTHKNIVIKRLDEADLQWDIGLVWRNNVPLSPAAKAWLQLARQHSPEP